MTDAYHALTVAGIADGVPVECKKVFAPRQKSVIEIWDTMNATMGLPKIGDMLGKAPDARLRF